MMKRIMIPNCKHTPQENIAFDSQFGQKHSTVANSQVLIITVHLILEQLNQGVDQVCYY